LKLGFFQSSWRLLFLLGIFWNIAGCAKIDPFDQAFVHEVFMGSTTITPSVKGIYSGAAPVGAVSVVGDATGRTVTIHGLPTNDPFPILPEKLMQIAGKGGLVPTISGFQADAIDKRTLKVTGFFSMSDSARDLGLEATGTIVRQGPQLATKADDPIIIRVKVRPLRALISKEFLEQVQTIQGAVPITEFSDEEMIPLYRIDFRAEVTSIF
jgi:hypothetical protein